jgi:hypothetical protein
MPLKKVKPPLKSKVTSNRKAAWEQEGKYISSYGKSFDKATKNIADSLDFNRKPAVRKASDVAHKKAEKAVGGKTYNKVMKAATTAEKAVRTSNQIANKYRAQETINKSVGSAKKSKKKGK